MATSSLKFGFNHMVAPALTPDELVTSAVKLGAFAIELRNDIGANSLNDIETARRVGGKAKDAGLEVRSVNALYPFNIWSDDLAHRAEALAAIAAASGATGLVMCPLNENELVEDTPEKAAGLRTALKELGVNLALDDFGTGYSSLSTLHSFPLDRIKIDRHFVAALGRDRDADAIIRAVIGLGRALRMQIVAEGVETTEQLAFLQAEGCNEVQGFLLARPSVFSDLTQHIGT